MAEVLSGVQRMKAIMVVNGLQPGPQAYAAQLRAALRLQELQVGSGVKARRAVRPREWQLGVGRRRQCASLPAAHCGASAGTAS